MGLSSPDRDLENYFTTMEGASKGFRAASRDTQRSDSASLCFQIWRLSSPGTSETTSPRISFICHCRLSTEPILFHDESLSSCCRWLTGDLTCKVLVTSSVAIFQQFRRSDDTRLLALLRCLVVSPLAMLRASPLRPASAPSPPSPASLRAAPARR